MIKNIIFDIGNVLIDYRWEDLIREFTSDEEEVQRIREAMWDDPEGKWTLYDLGLITREEVTQAFEKKYPDEAQGLRFVMSNPERMCVALPVIWEKMFLLKDHGYGIYLLSNYPKDLLEIHLKEVPFMGIVDGMVVSYMIHKRKPDAEIYQTLLERYQLDPQECVFFDDRLENVQGAVAAGMSAIQVVDTTQFLADMDIFLR